MKVFEFEQNLKNEYNEVNIIYKYANETFAIATLKGRSCLNEVKKEKRVVYNSLDELIEKSEQYSKYQVYHTFLVDTSKSTDASKWNVKQIYNIRFVKKELGITDDDIAEMFGYANTNSYSTSSAKKRYESGLVAFYKLIESKG
ncbi:MAG: hypothetical protein J5I47_01920 [Vicingus serpentipes]|nr:hypothetical protein [Vicingus serpentipes]